jgi:replicative DNA helicase
MSNSITSSVVREIGIDDLLSKAQDNLTGFGNPFLDDALLGIMPNDLCLIGAKSGLGKTQLATSIAAYNASACKKNVVFIALEAEKDEIEMRLRYSIEASLFFKDQNRDRGVTISYRKWRLGFMTQHLKKYREEGISIFIQRYATLHTVYRGESYGLKDFERSLDEAKDFGDIFIVDHLNFFDLMGNANSEHSEVSGIMKRIRALNLFYSKPFIVIAHLRKNIEGLVPATEDFMGSSDIGKIATMCVMLARDPQGYDPKTQTQKTIISIPKARTGGFGNLVGVLDYSIQHQGYIPRYKLARVSKGNDKVESISNEEIPDWASKAELNINQIPPKAK